jgi:hypothetical protein
MADRSTLQAGVDKLVARGFKQIVAVPLFVSSHSGVIEATKYLLGVRADAPQDIEDFVMAAEKSDKHESMPAPGPGDPADSKKTVPQPVKSAVPIRMTAALDQDPLVAAIRSSEILGQA